MAEEKQTTITQDKAAVNALIDGLTLFDDELMSRFFDKNIEATEFILRIIMGRKIKVISVATQVELKNREVGGRNITLDVHAIDVDGEEMDIEIQGNSTGAHVRRARYHSSMVDSRMLKEGQTFRELKDSYVIFIYRHDKYKKGLPLYHVNRYIEETGESFEDGSHIIYVNGNYKGNDEIGQLMKDFHQSDPKNMHYATLASGMKHFKETEDRDNVSEAVERYAKEYAKKYAKECVEQEKAISVKNLMENVKFTLEQALNALGIQGEEREQIKRQLQKQ